jgi:hypothetical protein
VKKIVEEIDKEKKQAIVKKEEERIALKKLLEENEIRKLVLADQLQKEREQDLKACYDYARVLDQQEKDRADYFKIRERKSSDFMSQVVDGVIKEINNKTKIEEENIKKFEKEIEKKYLIC